MDDMLFFDLEFISSTKQELLDEIKVEMPKNISKPETIEAWEKDKKPIALAKKLADSIFDPAFGEIVSASFALGEGEVLNAFRTDKISEKELLEKVNEILSILVLQKHGSYESKKPIVWTGHNIVECDLSYLWKRMIINNVRPCVKIPHDARPWSNDVYDILAEWGMQRRSSMDFIMKCLGMGGKGDFDGSMVGAAWLNGEYRKISKYNIKEIDQLREIYKRFNFK